MLFIGVGAIAMAHLDRTRPASKSLGLFLLRVGKQVVVEVTKLKVGLLIVKELLGHL